MVFEQKKPVDTALDSEIIKRANESSRRIRILEQRVERVEDTAGGLQGTATVQMNDLKIGLDRIGQRIKEVADKLSAIESEIARLNKELTRAATKREVKELESFIDLVNPITAKFVTKDELERALKGRVAEKA